MAAGVGYLDAQGIWRYGESDTDALFSDLLDLGQESVSTQFAADRARLDAAEDAITANRGRVPIIPTFSGTGVSVAADGLVTLTAAGASANPIRLDGLAGFRRVIIQAKVTGASVANTLALRLRTAVPADDTANSYDTRGALFITGAVSASAALSTAWTGYAPALSTLYSIDWELEDFDQARLTRGEQRYRCFAAAAAPTFSEAAISHRAATAYAGVALTTLDTSTVTGTVRLFGEV